MKHSFQCLVLCVSSIIVAALSVSSEVFLASARELPLQRPAGRSLLSNPPPKQVVELVAAPNGTVYLIVSDSRKVLWSFPSGPPIYLSYQAPVPQDIEKENVVSLSPSRYSFIDCGDDWELYLNYQYGKKKLKGTIRDYVKETPISEDDEVIVGSMHSTVFKVDFLSGRLIYDYGRSVSINLSQGGDDTQSAESRKKLGSSEFPNTKGSNAELYIERTDYSLSTKAFNKLLWNLTVGSFKAKLRCKATNHLLDGALNWNHKLGLGSEARGGSLPCGFEFVVRRFRKQGMFEYFLGLDGEPGPLSKHNMLAADAHADIEFSASHQTGLNAATRSLLRREVLETGTRSYSGVSNGVGVLRRYVPWSFVLLAVLLIGYALHHKIIVARGEVELNVESYSSSRPVSSRRKKSRKSGKNMLALEEGQDSENALKKWLNLNSLVQGETDGRTIGRLFVSSIEIAKGSSGTVVYEGIYEGRKVAVKRLVQAHHEVAFKEIRNLIASDQHPNIIRLYGVEYDNDFVYLSLERCSCSLNDLIGSYSDSSWRSMFFDDNTSSATAEYKARLSLVKATIQDIRLWKSNGYPSALLLKLLRDVVSGLVHLHELGIIHRDIKPQNVLISNDKNLCAKLSDMGISRRLLPDTSSLGYRATGHGTFGWQAPEQLLHGRQTRAMDLFSLGCVLFFCVTGGEHPFGDRFERDKNIIKNHMDLFLVENIPEALELFSRLLHPDPQMRPKALEVLHHPFFWESEMRLSFLHDTSDRIELEDREIGSDVLKALESIAPTAIGAKWDEKMEPAFLNNIGHYRRYKYDSVRDLLRVMRNKLNHYRELPAEIQGLLGPVPDGFDEYFRSRFPRLLIEVYKIMFKYCRSEKWFHKYLQGTVV